MITKGVLKLKEKKAKSTDTYELVWEFEKIESIKGEPLSGFSFIPGQFLNLDFAPKLSRSYSISSMPVEGLKLLIKIVPEGKGSAYIEQMKEGDLIDYKGPFGHFKLPEELNTPLCFIATGTGIAPFRSMIKSLPASFDKPIHLYYGARKKSDLVYLDEMDQWHKNLSISLALSQEEETFQFQESSVSLSRITPLIENAQINTDTHFFICGNGPMVLETKEILKLRGFKNIHEERFN